MHGYENFMVSSYRLNNAMSEYLTNRDHASQARVVELSLSAFTQADIFYSYYRNQIGYDLTYSLKNNFDRITMLFSEQPTIEEIDPYKLFIEELIKTSKAGTLEYGTFPNHPYNLEHAKKLLKVSEESKVTPK